MPRTQPKYVPREPSFNSVRFDYDERSQFVNLTKLEPEAKQALFKHLKANKPEVVGFLQDPFVQQLRTMFDGEICIKKTDLGA